MLHYQAVGYGDLGEVVCKMVNNESWVLGEYETFERAEEVVQELDDLYLGTKALCGNQPAENVIAFSLMRRMYRMPEE